MAFKSIIDIDINDAKFKEFLESFQKYKEKAENAPEDWHKLARAISGTSEEMRGLGRAQKAALGGADRDAHKLARSLKTVSAEQKGFARNAKMGSAGLKGFSLDAGAAARGLDALAAPVGVVVAGLGAIAAAGAKATLSLDKLTANKFKSAKELGMNIAQQQAFQNYGSQLFSNPDAMLTAMRNAKINPADSVPLRALGIGQNAINKDSPAQLSLLAAKKAHQILKDVPKNLRGTVWEAYTQGKLGGLGQAELFAGRRSSMARIEHYKTEYEKHEKAWAIHTAAARRAVNVTQAAGELKGRVVTGLENVAASKTMTTGAMAAIHGARAALTGGADLYHDAVNAGQAIITAGKQFATTTVTAAKTVARWYEGGKGLHARGDALKGLMLADRGTTREPAAKAAYEAFIKKHPDWKAKPIPKLSPLLSSKIPAYVGTLSPSMQKRAELKAHKEGLYLHGSNWRKYNNPGDVDPAMSVDGIKVDAYATYRSMGAGYRAMAGLIRGYHQDTVSGIMNRYDHGNPLQAKAVAGMMHVGLNQKLSLNNTNVMAGLVAAIAKSEQPHKRDYTQLQAAIVKAIRDGMAASPIHVHAKTGPGARIAVSAHAAAR